MTTLTLLWIVVALLVLLGSILAISETSISRLSRVRALALREEGRRNASVLVEIESDPPRYLNAIYLSVMIVQNGSAILVAILAGQMTEGNWAIALISAGFTLGYFVVVEAMSKTFGILHSDRAALGLAPVVWFLGRVMAYPTRLLIGLANILLPGKGLKQGPFVSEEEIRQLAEAGHEEGSIEEAEKELIHSIFEFGDTLVREVMVPRLDIVAADVNSDQRLVLDLILRHGYSRIPVFHGSVDEIVGIVYAKDLLRHLHAGKGDVPLETIMREPYFVPETKKLAELLKEMQQRAVHIAVVFEEHGSTAGLVTIEDLLEEIVGEIADEYDREEPQMESLNDHTYRVSGRFPIDDLNEYLSVDLPHDEWDTVAGLMYGILGSVPTQGETVSFANLTFTAERVQGRRIAKVLITRKDESQLVTQPEQAG
ncbi:MAG: HlyC/CorC family transporter [Actinobacteria bacterium]|nr:HlyC/CorC family transporter [Actinomycetota bacterium]